MIFISIVLLTNVAFCSEVHEQALVSCEALHRERRILLKQEIGRMVLFFADQPSLLAPNIQVNALHSGYVEHLIQIIPFSFF